MAAPDFTTAHLFPTMSTGSGSQGADISAPLSPLAPTFHQRETWQHEPQETPYSQNYDPFFTASLQHMNNQPYRDPHLARSPYAGYGGYQPMYLQPSTFSYASHQPRLPPAIRSGPVDALMSSSTSGVEEQLPRNDQTAPRGLPQFLPSHHIGHQGLLHSATGYSPYSMSSQPAMMLEAPRHIPYDDGPIMPSLRGGGNEETRQTLRPRMRPSQPHEHLQPPQRHHPQAEHDVESRNPNDAERRLATNLTAQNRRWDRSSSPRTSARRSFDRYSWDILQSSTSSDVEEAAARSPPSSRVRHRPREGRPRFFSQTFDPSCSTSRQIQTLKASLPKLLASELSKDTSPTCDICAKDYSTIYVQASEEEEIAVQLSCGHTFGEFCIGQWVNIYARNIHRG